MRTVEATFVRMPVTTDALRSDVVVVNKQAIVTLPIGLPFMERGTFEWDVPGQFEQYWNEGTMVSPLDWYKAIHRRQPIGAW